MKFKLSIVLMSILRVGVQLDLHAAWRRMWARQQKTRAVSRRKRPRKQAAE